MKRTCPIIDPEFVRNLIPHEHPFIMVDALINYTPNSAIASLTVKNDNIFVSIDELDHYGLMEHIAQTAALHKGYEYYLADRTPPVGYLAEIKKTKFTQSPKVGEMIKTKIDVLSEFNGILMIEFSTSILEIEIANGIFKTFTNSE